VLKTIRSNPWVVLFVLLTGFFMILLDSTIVSVALPSIVDSLHSGLDEVLWVTNGYILSYAVLLIVAGRLGDIYGPRNLFAAGMAIFMIASAACGLSQDTNFLIGARVVQGVGGALLSPQTLAVMTAIFPPERRGTAFGMWGVVAGVAAIVGPTLGGFLVDTWSWRWVFYVNLPVGLVSLVAAFLIIPNLKPGRQHRLDPVGVLLLSTGLFAIVFGLVEGEVYAWGVFWMWLTIPEIIALGVLLMVAFVVWERLQSEPMLPLSLFADRNFSVMNWTGVVMSVGMFGVTLVFTIYLQSVVGLRPLEAGLTMAPMPAVSLIVSPLAGRYSDRVGGKYILMTGLGLFALGIWMVTSVATTTSTWLTFLLPLVIMGLGQGCVFAPQATIALRHVAPRVAGVASGVLNTTRQMGAVLGSAAVGALLQNQLVVSLNEQALTYSGQVPAAFRAQFLGGFAQAAKSGLHVGRTQNVGSQLSAGIPPQIKDQLVELARNVFGHGYVDAMQTSMWLPVAALGIGVLSCLVVESQKKAADRAARRWQDKTSELERANRETS
jgi:EmrB/QacA subfamily drug resistance transporter